jgi:fructose PTS system EIIA component
MTNSIITPSLIDLDLEAPDRQAATRRLAERLVTQARVTDLGGFLADVTAREQQMPTGLEGGIGIPHARSAFVTEPSLAFARSKTGVDFGAADGPAHLIFLIAAPEGGGSEHMTILAALARRLVHASFREALAAAPDAQTVVDIVTKEVLGQ